MATESLARKLSINYLERRRLSCSECRKITGHSYGRLHVCAPLLRTTGRFTNTQTNTQTNTRHKREHHIQHKVSNSVSNSFCRICATHTSRSRRKTCSKRDSFLRVHCERQLHLLRFWPSVLIIEKFSDFIFPSK